MKSKSSSSNTSMSGQGDFANMPREVVMKPYPKPNYSMDEHLDDTIVRLDATSSDSEKKLKKYRPNSMY